MEREKNQVGIAENIIIRHILGLRFEFFFIKLKS